MTGTFSFITKPSSTMLQFQRGHPLANGLVCAVPFTEQSGYGSTTAFPSGLISVNAVFKDYSGYGNDATSFNQVPLMGGAFGNSPQFGSQFSTEYFTFPNSPSLNITGPISIHFWLMSTHAPLSVVFGGYSGSTGYGIAHNYPSSNQIGYFSGGFGSWVGVTMPGSTSDGNWHAVVVTVTSSAANFYWDGQFIGSQTSSYPNSYAGTRVFGSDVSNSNQYYGQLDALLIYNRTLSAAEVAQLYVDPFVIYRRRSKWWETVKGAAGTTKPTRQLPILGVGAVAPAVGVRVLRSLRDNPPTTRRGLIGTVLGDYEDEDG